MHTLEKIKSEIGEPLYKAWLFHVNRNMQLTKYRNREADAQHAYQFEEINKMYDNYNKVFTKSNPERCWRLR